MSFGSVYSTILYQFFCYPIVPLLYAAVRTAWSSIECAIISIKSVSDQLARKDFNFSNFSVGTID
jgi:hypothetical protein